MAKKHAPNPLLDLGLSVGAAAAIGGGIWWFTNRLSKPPFEVQAGNEYWYTGTIWPPLNTAEQENLGKELDEVEIPYRFRGTDKNGGTILQYKFGSAETTTLRPGESSFDLFGHTISLQGAELA